MDEKYTVTGIDKNANCHLFTLRAFRNGDEFRLVLSGNSLTEFQAAGDDFFSALVDLRIQIEVIGLQLLVKGAARNVTASRMSRQMSGGIRAFTLENGKPRSLDSLVNIFDPADETEITTVAEQKQFYASWSKSL